MLSLGFMPQTSLSELAVAALDNPAPLSPGVHAPDFVERFTHARVRAQGCNCLWGSCPRLR